MAEALQDFEGLLSEDTAPGGQGPPPALRLLTRLSEWLYLAPKQSKSSRVLVNVPDAGEAFSSHFYELFTGRRQKDKEEEEDDVLPTCLRQWKDMSCSQDWQEAVVEGEEANTVQVQLLGGSRISVPQDLDLALEV